MMMYFTLLLLVCVGMSYGFNRNNWNNGNNGNNWNNGNNRNNWNNGNNGNNWNNGNNRNNGNNNWNNRNNGNWNNRNGNNNNNQLGNCVGIDSRCGMIGDDFEIVCCPNLYCMSSKCGRFRGRE